MNGSTKVLRWYWTHERVIQRVLVLTVACTEGHTLYTRNIARAAERADAENALRETRRQLEHTRNAAGEIMRIMDSPVPATTSSESAGNVPDHLRQRISDVFKRYGLSSLADDSTKVHEKSEIPQQSERSMDVAASRDSTLDPQRDFSERALSWEPKDSQESRDSTSSGSGASASGGERSTRKPPSFLV
eukprot:CAMPEP_0185835712 /NCGR_PEP_ID=MMETSP1353-20130828/8281_1 /TAXON_ID=1077150 /ORGANISM="Erythrolobus australicus, Strain CCMP3124" /LENGTH=188 /DNA_ID=CAMNT_0028534381 /DNA_START=1 /DNA_END=567 /DNA_ORIENTATION=-